MSDITFEKKSDSLAKDWNEFLESYKLLFLMNHKKDIPGLLERFECTKVTIFKDSICLEYKTKEGACTVACWKEEPWFELSVLYTNDPVETDEAEESVFNVLEVQLQNGMLQNIFYEFVINDLKPKYQLPL